MNHKKVPVSDVMQRRAEKRKELKGVEGRRASCGAFRRTSLDPIT